jgi:hypothetical protein
MIVFVLAAGFLGILPTWFLLKVGIKAAPRALLVGGIVVALIGPFSWLSGERRQSIKSGPQHRRAGRLSHHLPRHSAHGGRPGPAGVSFLILRDREMRMLLAAAMLMNAVPLGLFGSHMARAPHY